MTWEKWTITKERMLRRKQKWARVLTVHPSINSLPYFKILVEFLSTMFIRIKSEL